MDNSNSPDTHLDLGKALEKSGDNPGAESEYRAAIGLRPGYPDAEFELDKLLIESGNASAELEGIEHFRRALRSDPDNAPAQ